MVPKFRLGALCCALLILLGSILINGAATSASSSGNLIKAGDFQGDTSAWRIFGSYPSTGPSYAVEPAVPGSSDLSAKLSLHPDGRNTYITVDQLIYGIEPGARYHFSASVLAGNNTVYEDTKVTVVWADHSKGDIRVEFPITPSHTEEWQLVEQDLTAQGNMNSARVEMRISSNAFANMSDYVQPVYFDNFSLTKIADPPPTPTPSPTATPVPPSPCNRADLSTAPGGTHAVRMNEVLTNPDPNAERPVQWLELYSNADLPMELTYWYFDDGPGGHRCYQFRDKYVILAHDFLVWYPGAAFHFSTGESTLRLIDPNGEVVDQIEVPELGVGRSVQRIPDGADALSTDWLPTPKMNNGSNGHVPQPTPTPGPSPQVMSVSQARNAAPDTYLQIEGTVTAPPNLLGSGKMYVQDSTAGVLVLLPSTEKLTLLPGQTVQVTGKADTYYGERAVRAEPSGITIKGYTSEQSVKTVHTGQVGPGTEGSLVRVTGTVNETGKPVVLADDDSGTARIEMMDSTDIAWPDISKGDRITATGIVGSYNGTYRLMPRYDQDVFVQKKQTPPPPFVTIHDARGKPDGVLVETMGVVTAPPNALGKSRLYIEDGTGGLLVTSTPDNPKVRTGDVVEVVGHTGTSRKERLLQVANDKPLKLLSRNQDVFPTAVSLDQIGRGMEGRFVQISGIVQSSSWPSIYIGSESKQVRALAMASANLKNPHILKGDLVRVQGVVSRYNDKYRLLPFRNEHTKLLHRPSRKPAYASVTVAGARGSSLDRKVETKGTVTVPPGVFADNMMYVEDSTGGVMVTGKLPTVRAGMLVRVRGKVSTYHGETRLTADSVSVLRWSGYVTPKLVTLSDFGSRYEGRLVIVQGSVSHTGWPSIYLGKQQVRAYAPSHTGIPNPKAKQGDYVTAMGVVSQWDGKYRLELRYAQDLHLVHVSSPGGSNGSTTSRNDNGSNGKQGSATGGKASNHDIAPVSTTLSGLRALPVGTAVRLQAQVTAPPNLLGAYRVYVGDSTNGIALHLPSGTYPNLREGDYVSIEGTLSTYHGERVVRLESAGNVKFMRHGIPLRPTLMDASEVGPLTEGRLVTISGVIEEQGWPSLTVRGLRGTVRVSVSKYSGIPRLGSHKGDLITVTGLVSQRDGHYRVLPRYRADIVVHALSKPGDPPASDSTSSGPSSDEYTPSGDAVTAASSATGDPQPQTTTVLGLRGLPVGTWVRFTGQVTAPSGVFGPEKVYIGDSQGGIALRLPSGGFPALREGDTVSVRGQTDTYHGEYVVRLESGSDVRLTGHGTPLAPVGVDMGQLSPGLEGRLITLNGKVAERQWPSLILTDGTGSAKVRVQDSTGIPRLELGKGSPATITGIYTQWDGTWRLLPRWTSDFHAIKPPHRVPETGGGGQSSPPGSDIAVVCAVAQRRRAAA